MHRVGKGTVTTAVGSVTARVVLYALVAALSPLALISTLAVLRSARGRINGTAFTIGIVAGQAAALALLLAIGSVSIPPQSGGYPTLESVVEIGLGVMLIVMAPRVRRHPVQPHHESPRTQAALARLTRISPGAAVTTGVALGIGGPKRLGITLVAAATISTNDIGESRTISLALLYVAIATVLVWAPTIVYLVLGTRARDVFARAEQWLRAHRQAVEAATLTGLGAVLIVDAVVRLLTA